MSIAELLGAISERGRQAKDIPGEVGKPTGTGTFLLEPEDGDRPGFIIVRIKRGGASEFVEAINFGVPMRPRCPCKVRMGSDGFYEAHPDGVKTQQFMGSGARVGLTNPHSHEPGLGNEDQVSSRRVLIGLVHTQKPASMIVVIEPFNWGIGEYYPGGVLDLTAYQPSTADTWAWVKVGIDPTTNSAIAVMGTEYSVTTPLTEDMLDEVSFYPYLPLAGVRVAESDTTISAEARFADARVFVSGQASGQRVAVRVVTAAGAVTVANTDYVVVVNKSSGAATTVNLPAGTTGRVFVIKDGKGDAATNNITLDGNGAETIDGAATYVMNANYQSATILWNGTQWNVI